MKAFEMLDSDDPAAAENAAEILRTMARICDDLRHLGGLVRDPDIFSGRWSRDGLGVDLTDWLWWFGVQSGDAPVEDWLDDQWALVTVGIDPALPLGEDPALADVPFDDWPPAAKARLLADVLPHAQPSTPTTPGGSHD